MSGFHESLDAALGRAGERDEVEALGAELGTYRKHGVGLSPVGANTAARAVLASDWLDQRIEQAKAEERERIASAIEAVRPEMGLHINVTEYRRGLDDGLIKAARIAREVPNA